MTISILGVESAIKSYEARSFNRFLNERNADEDISEGDEWKRQLKDSKGEIPPPPFTITRTWFKPQDILNITESYSLEALFENPDNPKLDVLTVDLKDGISLILLETFEELEKKIEEWINHFNKKQK
jgi:hypothetical protein